MKSILICLCISILAMSSSAFAQDSASAPIRLETAVELALQNYPEIRASLAQASAASTNIDLAQHTYLPRLEFDWQQTRGTRSNILGQFFPQPAILPISGPVLAGASFTESSWGSGGGVVISWEPFDFGARKAAVDVAKRAGSEAEARVAITRLEVATGAADAFLRVIAADQAVRGAQASVVRMEAFSTAVHALVDNQLRPGSDASRTDAELAAARSLLVQARRNAALARLALTEAMGQAGQPVAIDPGPLLELPPPNSVTAAVDQESHPLVIAQRAALAVILARQHLLDRSFAPRFNWQTAVFARGSGARVDGQLLESRGFYPNTGNWATGLTISFAPSDIFNLRSRRKQESYNLAAERARSDQTIQKLVAEEARARVSLESARELAANTPRQVAAAAETELRVRKRYEAELGTVVEVAEAQRLLAQAEIENDLARLGMWRALLAQALAKGDIKPFLELLQVAQRRP